MPDVDLNNFGYSYKKLDSALHKILLSLRKKFSYQPTVVWSGNGYHVPIVVEPLPRLLEDMPEFARFTEPSKKILRFLEKRLSNGKSDHVHNSNVSFGNCMLRVPGTFNSKRNNTNNKVKVIREWDNQKLSIKPLLGDFLAYLLDEQNKKPHGTCYYYDKYNNNLLSKE